MQKANFESTDAKLAGPVTATFGLHPIGWPEFATMREQVKHWLAVHKEAAAGLRNLPNGSWAHSRCTAKVDLANGNLRRIADRLASELVCSVAGIDHLLSKWVDHHYRPTLRGGPASPEMALADLYDHFAKVKSINVEAYRG